MDEEKKEKEKEKVHNKQSLHYKAFHGDLTSWNGFQYDIGKTYHLEKGTELEMCKRGFHCCELALNCIEYYEPTARFCEVQIGSYYITQNGKTVTDSITILRELERPEIDQLLTGKVRFASGCQLWYVKGQLHRKDGPSIIYPDGQQEWWVEDQLHRVGGPAILDVDGRQEWWFEGQRHREHGPAVKYPDGRQEWWFEGQRHREHGPAVIYASGRQDWWCKGQLHRVGGPAILDVDGRQEWWFEGQLHREHGPALIYANGGQEWWFEGRFSFFKPW